jgi:hypothetical protein
MAYETGVESGAASGSGPQSTHRTSLTREDLHLICFDFFTGG